MGEDDDRRAVGEFGHVLLEPGELLWAERAELARSEVTHVDQSDEMDSLIIEALPAVADGPFAVAIEIAFPVVGEDIVFARDIGGVLRFHAPDNLIDGVELRRLRQMRQIAGVQQQDRGLSQRIDPRRRSRGGFPSRRCSAPWKSRCGCR